MTPVNPNAGSNSLPDSPDPATVCEHLERVLEGSEFRQSPRMQSFLRFVVRETLEGRGDQLKAYTIGLDVYKKGPDFDPGTDPIVRVDARRLRRKLQSHYADDGADEPIRIELPKGRYAPRFRRVTPPADQGAASADPRGHPTLLVAPFENLSNDTDQAFFCDGLTDEIIAELTRYPDVRVLGRQTSFQAIDDQVEIVPLAQRNGARFVLEGTVRRGKNKIRVTAHLIDGETGHQLWADSYTSDLTAQDIIEIQDEITRGVVVAIAEPYGAIPQLLTEDAHRRTSESLSAYEWVLRFYRYWAEPLPERYESMRDNLPRAVELDPTNASLHAAHALVCVDAARFFADPLQPEDEWLRRSTEAARRAVELDSGSPFAFQALAGALFHTRDLAGFHHAASTAVRLSPNHSNVLADLAVLHALIDEWDVAMPMAERAIALNPQHPAWYNTGPCLHALHRGEHDSAARLATLQVTPGLTLTSLAAAVALDAVGSKDEAAGFLSAARSEQPDLTSYLTHTARIWNMQPWLTQLLNDVIASDSA